jgi:hypothetical protein
MLLSMLLKMKSRRIGSKFGIPLTFSLSLLLLTNCFWQPTRDFKTCKYRFQSVAFSSVDASQTHWKLGIVVNNPNKRPVILTRMHFALLHLNDTLLSGMNPTQREIASLDSQVIETNLDIPNTVLKKLPSSIWSDTKAEFTVTAGAFMDTWLGPIEVPGAIRQTIHINMPEQLAKYRDMMIQKMFSWPAKKLKEDP